MNFDPFIIALDNGIRTVFGAAQALRPDPAAGIPEADLAALNVSKLSASALMSNHFGERTLRQINGCLPKALQAVVLKRDCVL